MTSTTMSSSEIPIASIDWFLRLRAKLEERDYRLVQTHISNVFVGRESVYKLKKPVDLGFLDFSTPERRLEACQAEVELNRRLAPDVYLGVVPVVDFPNGCVSVARPPEEGARVVDWAVHMRRLDDRHRADVILERGRLDRRAVRRIARRLARFHRDCETNDEIAEYGSPESIRRNVLENFDQTAESIHRFLDPTATRELEAWQLDFLERHADVLRARQRDGRVRDGHGDLRLEHVYFETEDDEPRGEDLVGARTLIVDCIEFNRRFRYADVAADLAFLAMDLSAQGAVDLAETLLAEYARAADDHDLYRVVDFYESYRAFVRAKVSCFTASDPCVDATSRAKAETAARRFFLLAQAEERRPLMPPGLVVTSGAIASGKSRVARTIADRLGAPIVEADTTRKRMLSVQPTQPVHVKAFSGAYSPSMSERVYAELLRRAEIVLRSGRSVVLDASYRSRAHRAAARRLAQDIGVPMTLVECRADPDTLRRRLERRTRKSSSTSDGRLEILDDFLASMEPVTEEELATSGTNARHLVLDTTAPKAEVDALVAEAFPGWDGLRT